jgi:UDP-N-acetylmuramyl tripeptide synthase
MDKRKVGSENGYSATSTPIQTKIQRPSLTSSPVTTTTTISATTATGRATTPRSRTTRANLADIIDTQQELEKIFSSYGEVIRQRKSEVSELKKVNFSRQHDENGDDSFQVSSSPYPFSLLSCRLMSSLLGSQ